MRIHRRHAICCTDAIGAHLARDFMTVFSWDPFLFVYNMRRKVGQGQTPQGHPWLQSRSAEFCTGRSDRIKLSASTAGKGFELFWHSCFQMLPWLFRMAEATEGAFFKKGGHFKLEYSEQKLMGRTERYVQEARNSFFKTVPNGPAGMWRECRLGKWKRTLPVFRVSWSHRHRILCSASRPKLWLEIDLSSNSLCHETP